MMKLYAFWASPSVCDSGAEMWVQAFIPPEQVSLLSILSISYSSRLIIYYLLLQIIQSNELSKLNAFYYFAF